MSETSACSVAGCKQPAAAHLEMRALCREHFVTACYDRIDEYRDRLSDRPYPLESTEGMWQFVNESSQQLIAMTQQVSHLENLERARLLDLLLCVAELSQRLRRSPRKAAVLPVLLRCQEPGRAWEEVGVTRFLSRCGALIECRNPVQVGDALLLARIDTGKKVQARVVWSNPGKEGTYEVGLEFLSGENYWELDWDAIETAT
jgi:PilZ domain-containing protein